MARGKAHSEQTKAQVLAALFSGEQPAEVAQRFGVSKATVSEWGKAGGVDFEQVRTKKEINLQNLVADYLSENLQTLAAQSIHFRDPHWIREQKADAMAVLHGVMADKAIRILEAAAAAQPLENLDNSPRAITQ